ncbi:Pyridoxine 5'-phosphate synthase [Flexistipes sinusarabici DSM 4947]|uniref:Pyridoxine 5'-phosphate synthase n=1 Tax=Flexistipes sinusarabici (strain ATCC 49648 / DSM 4947 / MAS 10) TaxID=717231 RepID=F8E5D7_FLESM|nr:pyridoxine 5'-phosphate synthase [Flexistipes sinusarabici]AEI14633.1 Pyridoxine 5'-phosphate synthase [Flexistipes sinusarabici DSM 4947]
MIKLGVNVDHVATLRQARLIKEPDPVEAAVWAEHAGADGITVHLREDTRHIQHRDVSLLKDILKTRLNLEMSVNHEIVEFACEIKPYMSTLVPEKREELTTEGGLDVIGNEKELSEALKRLINNNIKVSLFIDPDIQQIKAAKNLGVNTVELHTGSYAEAEDDEQILFELQKLIKAAEFAKDSGMVVNAGHGLNYRNTKELCRNIPFLNELNIGHSIVARSVFTGICEAVKEMKRLIGE